MGAKLITDCIDIQMILGLCVDVRGAEHNNGITKANITQITIVA